MLRFTRQHPDSPETPRMGEVRERGEVRRLCLAGAPTAEEARWVYEGDAVRVRVVGGSELRGVARELEPGVIRIAAEAGVRRVFLGEIAEIEVLPMQVPGLSGS